MTESQPAAGIRIAMWSGPRNISTALMRAWENRADCCVWDEPLYGYYLAQTGIDHPGADEIIAAHGSNAHEIIARCRGPIPSGKTIFYQKHMTLHLLPDLERDWLRSLVNCFLLREPEPVIASYSAVRGGATLDDIGFVQQAELFDFVRELTGEVPAVIDSREFLQQPEAQLRALCAHVGVDFDPAMLHWPAGVRDSDGAWGKYWYDSVWQSTGFTPWLDKPVELSPAGVKTAAAARPYYEKLYAHRLCP
ncbi:MAG: HAD family hydrolase [Gammaproteobacteria bacterium]|nr:HAD family hydrolase [Gammaproteobacteria bacterium]